MSLRADGAWMEPILTAVLEPTEGGKAPKNQIDKFAKARYNCIYKFVKIC